MARHKVSTKGSIIRNARRLLRFLSEKKDDLSPMLILTHDYPDPDAMASAYALHYLLDKFYHVHSRIAYGGVIGRVENRAMVNILKIPVHKIKKGDLRKYKSTALIDTQPAFENNSFPKNWKATLVIDQHPEVTKPNAEMAILDYECEATAAILAEAMLLVGIEIPTAIGTALVYGILTDTLNLYRIKHEDVIRVYLDLLPYCDLKALAMIQYPSRSRRFFSSLGKGIKNAKVRQRLIVCHLGDVESPDVVSQNADFFLTYKNMTWSFCTGRFKGKLYASLRMSRTGARASEILRDIFENSGEAGGHELIAGGSIKIQSKSESAWLNAEDSMTKRLMKRLRIPVKGVFYYPFRRQNG